MMGPSGNRRSGGPSPSDRSSKRAVTNTPLSPANSTLTCTRLSLAGTSDTRSTSDTTGSPGPENSTRPSPVSTPWSMYSPAAAEWLTTTGANSVCPSPTSSGKDTLGSCGLSGVLQPTFAGTSERSSCPGISRSPSPAFTAPTSRQNNILSTSSGLLSTHASASGARLTLSSVEPTCLARLGWTSTTPSRINLGGSIVTFSGVQSGAPCMRSTAGAGGGMTHTALVWFKTVAGNTAPSGSSHASGALRSEPLRMIITRLAKVLPAAVTELIVL
mmetsp:Transcript_8454/g.15283  ORF Transcript_8454/g.15283 Transcript_8454/m.15283 type:complete len:273 (-) Transcript_8454:376-1194(-)